jgi:hypothetical protein
MKHYRTIDAFRVLIHSVETTVGKMRSLMPSVELLDGEQTLLYWDAPIARRPVSEGLWPSPWLER